MLGFSGKQILGIAVVAILVAAYGRQITSKLPASQA